MVLIDVEKNLNLPHSTSFKFLNELINLKLIHIKNDIVHINQKWFSKGLIVIKAIFDCHASILWLFSFSSTLI